MLHLPRSGRRLSSRTLSANCIRTGIIEHTGLSKKRASLALQRCEMTRTEWLLPQTNPKKKKNTPKHRNRHTSIHSEPSSVSGAGGWTQDDSMLRTLRLEYRVLRADCQKQHAAHSGQEGLRLSV